MNSRLTRDRRSPSRPDRSREAVPDAQRTASPPPATDGEEPKASNMLRAVFSRARPWSLSCARQRRFSTQAPRARAPPDDGHGRALRRACDERASAPLPRPRRRRTGRAARRVATSPRFRDAAERDRVDRARPPRSELPRARRARPELDDLQFARAGRCAGRRRRSAHGGAAGEVGGRCRRLRARRTVARHGTSRRTCRKAVLPSQPSTKPPRAVAAAAAAARVRQLAARAPGRLGGASTPSTRAAPSDGERGAGRARVRPSRGRPRHRYQRRTFSASPRALSRGRTVASVSTRAGSVSQSLSGSSGAACDELFQAGDARPSVARRRGACAGIGCADADLPREPSARPGQHGVPWLGRVSPRVSEVKSMCATRAPRVPAAGRAVLRALQRSRGASAPSMDALRDARAGAATALMPMRSCPGRPASTAYRRERPRAVGARRVAARRGQPPSRGPFTNSPAVCCAHRGDDVAADGARARRETSLVKGGGLPLDAQARRDLAISARPPRLLPHRARTSRMLAAISEARRGGEARGGGAEKRDGARATAAQTARCGERSGEAATATLPRRHRNGA